MIKTIAPQIVNLQWQRAIRLWRDGRYKEAREVGIDLLTNGTRLSADEELIIRKDFAVFERDAGRPSEALEIILKASPLAEVTEDYALRGRFNNQLALIYQELGEYDKAIDAFTEAAYWHEVAGGDSASAYVQNNIGNVLIDAGRPGDAHTHLDRAERVFKNLGELIEIAQVNDTRARAYLKQGLIDDALECSLASVDYLRQQDETRFLSVSLETLSLVCQAKRIYDALVCADGCITETARALGIKHNTSLNHLLETKFPQLLGLRKPKTHSRRKK